MLLRYSFGEEKAAARCAPALLCPGAAAACLSVTPASRAEGRGFERLPCRLEKAVNDALDSGVRTVGPAGWLTPVLRARACTLCIPRGRS